MKLMMTANEVYYRKVTTAIGVAMLTFLILLNSFGLALGLIESVLIRLPISDTEYLVWYQLIYAAGYLFSFMMPVAVLRSRIRKCGYPCHPMKTRIRLTPYLIPTVLGGIVLIWTQSYINADLVSVFNYSAFSADVLWGDSASFTPVEVVLQFIVIAMVPAFCEEFLFRGAILTNLLPFGRGTAILISSLLFGIMHQNAEQILYAFGAGILLGLVYERTGSIWNCTLLHLVNNFISYTMIIASDKLGGFYPELMNVALEAALCMVGFVCLAVLAVVFSEKKQTFADGVFGKRVEASDAYAACPVEPKRAFKLFLSFPNVLFFVFSALQILLLIGLAMLYSYAF